MALPSFIQHLDVLERAGLVSSTKAGASAPTGSHRNRCRRPSWMAGQRRLWERRLDQFDDFVRTLKETEQ